MAGMICTNCHRQTGVELECETLSVEAIIVLCENWRCNDCLDDLERELEEQKEG